MDGHIQTSGIETYSCFLNVVLFETNPDKSVEVAKAAKNEIERIRVTRVQDRTIQWRPEMREQPAEKAEFYQPRIYILSGSFDVAAVFASSSIEMAPWLQTDQLLIAGQDINMCLLPTGKSLGFPSRKDFNAQFLDEYRQERNQETDPLPNHMSFCTVIKLKVNPLVLWQLPVGPADKEKGKLRDVLKKVWECLEDWRRASKTESGIQPLVSLGLSYGWNEILILAHADHPGKLLDLALRLRQPTMSAQIKENLGRASKDSCIAHLALTTVSVLGHDLWIRAEARKCLVDEPIKEDQERILGSQLVKLAIELGKSYGAAEDPPSGSFLQVGFHTYPGHEAHLLEMVTEVAQALQEELGLTLEENMSCSVDVGKRDIWTPRIPIQGKLTPICAMALGGLIQAWVRHGGLPPMDSEENTGRRIPDAFDLFTRIASSLGDDLTKNLKSRPPNHVLDLPRRLLSGPQLKAQLYERTRLPEIAEKARQAMRVLQFPYALSEQILNFLNVFFWADDREILWDESVELIPAVLAFVSYVDSRKNWWNEEVNRLRRLASVQEFQTIAEERLQQQLERVRNQLSAHSDPLVVDLLQAFRAYFYNRQFANYLLGEMPDLNLRYKGSLHQLLSISNMILDSLVDMILGPRACMAIFGDRTSPEVGMPCDVTIVQLNATAFRTPLMLESLAHEVGHQFLKELVREGHITPARTHAWASQDNYPAERRATFEELHQTMKLLNRDVFLGRLEAETDDQAKKFVESASDFIELCVLGYEQLWPWVRSFLLRTVLASKSNTLLLPKPSKSALNIVNSGTQTIDVPGIDDQMISSAIIRAACVVIARELVDWKHQKKRPLDFEEFRQTVGTGALERLRQELYSGCVLGPAATAEEYLRETEKWQIFLQRYVFDLPWLTELYAMEQVSKAYDLLEQHVRWVPQPDYKGTARLWVSIRDSFHGLWLGPRQDNGKRSGGLSEEMLPALYIQQWMNSKEIQEAREGVRKATIGYTPPWRTKIQPFETDHKSRNDKDLSPKEYKAFVFQRGAILPAQSNHKTWEDLNRSFFARLLMMVPAWHRAILTKVENILGR